MGKPDQPLAENTELEFRIMQESDIEPVLDEFYRVELEPGPLFNATGVRAEDVEPVATSWLRHIVPQQLAMMAVDGDKVAGIILGEDFSSPWSSSGVALSPRIEPCMALLDALAEKYYEANEPPPGHTINIMVMKVRKTYSGKNVSKTFLLRGLPILRERGYKRIIAFLSSPISQHLARDRFGFRVEEEIRYADFEWNGTRPFADIQDAESMMVMSMAIA